jgi:hypothetical protein
MNDHDEYEPRNQKEDLTSSSILGKWFARNKHWRTLIFIIVILIAIAIAVNSIVRYESTRLVNPSPTDTPSVTTPPVNTSTPQFIDNLQEAFLSVNNCVLAITPGNDDSLNDSVSDLVLEAAKRIRAKDNIYVGVYVLPTDNSAIGPTVLVRVQHHDETKSDFNLTIREDITLTKIFQTYLSFAFIQ